MASTSGFVQGLTWSGDLVCARVGPSSSAAELLFIEYAAADPAHLLAAKRGMAAALATAQGRGWPIDVGHPDDGGQITSVDLPAADISPVGPVVRDDFLGVTGTGIPSDAQVVFQSTGVSVTITPDLVRPHWVFVSRLPAAVPPGRNTVRLQASGWSSDEISVEVSAGARTTVRTLYGGTPKDSPYTIVFVANPAIETEGGSVVADPVLGDRAGYHAAVRYCLRNLFTVTEDVLRQGDMDRHIRVVSVFDATLPAVADNALAHEISPNLMETRRAQLNGFLSRFAVRADIVLVLHGSTTHDRATAWFTTDDGTRGSTPFTYDGVGHTHGHHPSIPGSAAIPTSVDTTGLTALHEFGHASSDFNNGRVVDLYVDGLPPGFLANKKARAQATDPVPASFATYNGTAFAADPSRDSIGYPTTWTSYHPQLVDATRPNAMDNYWLAADPLRCRLDRLTFAWLMDRLRAKTLR
jgi:hypothetical protein